MNTIDRHFRELEAAKFNVAKDIVYTLDLFDGKLSLTDVMNTPLPFLDKLKDAKYAANEKHKSGQANVTK